MCHRSSSSGLARPCYGHGSASISSTNASSSPAAEATASDVEPPNQSASPFLSHPTPSAPASSGSTSCPADELVWQRGEQPGPEGLRGSDAATVRVGAAPPLRARPGPRRYCQRVTPRRRQALLKAVAEMPTVLAARGRGRPRSESSCSRLITTGDEGFPLSARVGKQLVRRGLIRSRWAKFCDWNGFGE